MGRELFLVMILIHIILSLSLSSQVKLIAWGKSHSELLHLTVTVRPYISAEIGFVGQVFIFLVGYSSILYLCTRLCAQQVRVLICFDDADTDSLYMITKTERITLIVISL